jgi:hypothetical protein
MFTRALVALLIAAPCFSACSSNTAQKPTASDPSDAGAAGEPAGGSEEPGSGAGGAADAGEPGSEAGAASEGGSMPSKPGGKPTSSSGAAFFLPTDTPTNTSAPRVEVDAKGGTHFLYPAFAIGDAFYGYCSAGCAGPDDVKSVRLETQGSVTNAALALDAAGRPRALLATFTSVYYAACDSHCTDAANWTTTKIIDHGSDYEVTGEALALQDGKPRFLMHAYRKFLGAFQKPETLYVECDEACDDASSWSQHSISNQLWEDSTLRFDARGTAHVATVVQVVQDGGPITKIGAYFACTSDCDTPESWKGLGRDYAYESLTADPTIQPSVSLALTKSGAPRLIVLGKDDDGNARISYHECDQHCTEEAGWAPYMSLTDPHFGAGIDLALDAQDQPRIAFTSGFDIDVAECSQQRCSDADAEWKFSTIERASSMKPDDIILWPNCTVSSWLLHSPSIAIGASGRPELGYQARDISGGTRTPDPTKPACTAGTDMSLTRALLR